MNPPTRTGAAGEYRLCQTRVEAATEGPRWPTPHLTALAHCSPLLGLPLVNQPETKGSRSQEGQRTDLWTEGANGNTNWMKERAMSSLIWYTLTATLAKFFLVAYDAFTLHVLPVKALHHNQSLSGRNSEKMITVRTVLKITLHFGLALNICKRAFLQDGIQASEHLDQIG